MNAIGVLGMRRSLAAARLRGFAILLLICAGACNAAAVSERVDHVRVDDVVVAQAFVGPTDGHAQMEISASSLPRFDGNDGATRSSRIDMTLLPTRQSSLGPSLAMTTPDARGLPSARPFSSSSTSVDLGLHWRYISAGNYRFDVSAWRRMNPVDAASLIESREPSYGARVEMHLATARRSGFVADHRFLGLQLESGARITVRRSGGKPMLYYRSSF
jgi:hypothetical protein